MLRSWIGRAFATTSIGSWTRASNLVPDRLARALLDTSVVIDLDRIPADALPAQVAVSAVTMAELAAGPAATSDETERARRQDRLQRAEATFDPLPLDTEAARAYGRVYAAVRVHGRNPRRRFADLLIAAVALANALPVLTRNAADFAGLDDLIDIVEI
jgi:predicted nucleic acid-binding protein